MNPAVALLLLFAGAAARTPARPFAEERQLLDRRLEVLRRILPDGAHPSADTALVADLARATSLEVAAAARAPLENSTHGEVIVDVSLTARFAEIERFFRYLSLSPRLPDVDSLTLRAAAGETVQATAVVRFPYRPASAPLSVVPEGVRESLANVPRPQTEAFLRDQALALAKTEAIATLRRSRRNPRLFLAELAAVVRDRPVVLREAVLGDDFAIRGLVVGQGPMDALEARLEKGFFRISDVYVMRLGACFRFEARGRSPVAGVEAELPLPTVDDPFRESDDACRADRDSGRAVVVKEASKVRARRVRGGRPAPAGPAPGTYSLRLRDIDAADVFSVLHLLSGRAFLVDEDVRGRLYVETSGLALEPTLQLLGKAGFSASAPGLLVRISSGTAPPVAPEAPALDGPRAGLALKRARVRDLLDVFNEADPSLALVAGTRSLGRVSVFAADLPVALLVDGVRKSARLEEQQEGGRPVLAGRPGAPLESDEVEPPLTLLPNEVVTSEFRLAGVASAGGEWIAFAYAPTGALHAFRRGDALADGRIAQVESTDVLIETDEGGIRVGLPDLR